jgi:hypothetical protein
MRHQTVARLVGRLGPSCLAKAFRGELVEQNSEDESAATLLEKVRRRSEVMQVTKKPKHKRTQAVEPISERRIDDLLASILKSRGRMTPERLLDAAKLDIDDFYDQLKREEARGLLREVRKRGDDGDDRWLEATT